VRAEELRARLLLLGRGPSRRKERQRVEVLLITALGASEPWKIVGLLRSPRPLPYDEG
jgi:hypothetical protein